MKIIAAQPVPPGNSLLRGLKHHWGQWEGFRGGHGWRDLVGRVNLYPESANLVTWSGPSGLPTPGSVQPNSTKSNNNEFSGTIRAQGPPVTLAVWAKCTESLNAYAAVVSTAGSPFVSLLFGGAGGTPLTYMWDGEEYSLSTGLSVSVGSVYFMAVSISVPAATVYLSPAGGHGKLLSYTNTKTHSTFTGTTTIYIGTERGGFGGEYRAWTGPIGEVLYWERALSAADLQAYKDQSLANYAGLWNVPDQKYPTRFQGGGTLLTQLEYQHRGMSRGMVK